MDKEKQLLSIRIWKKEKISRDIWKDIKPQFRKNMLGFSYHIHGNYKVPISVLSDDEKIEDYFRTHPAFGDGFYVVSAYKQIKNSHRTPLTKKIFSFEKKGNNIILTLHRRFSYFYFRRNYAYKKT